MDVTWYGVTTKPCSVACWVPLVYSHPIVATVLEIHFIESDDVIILDGYDPGTVFVVVIVTMFRIPKVAVCYESTTGFKTTNEKKLMCEFKKMTLNRGILILKHVCVLIEVSNDVSNFAYLMVLSVELVEELWQENLERSIFQILFPRHCNHYGSPM